MATTTPEEHGPCGYGGIDNGPLLAALATGRHVELDPSRQYRHTVPLPMVRDGQALVGGGLSPVGAINAIEVGACRGAEIDLVMRCAEQTAGYAALFTGAERSLVKKLFIQDSGFRGIGVQRSNSITVDYLYGIELRGDVGVRWYGDDGQRSDILNLEDVTVAFAAHVRGALGLDWWGNCHSLHVENFHAVGRSGPVSPLRHGLLVRNHAGAGTSPQIGRINNFASDFSQSHGLLFLAGDDIDVNTPYQNGSVEGSGVYVGPGLQDYAVRVQGGKTIGNARYGVEAASKTNVRDVLSYANGAGTHGGAITGNILTR